MDADGNRADIAKTIENCWFSIVFEGRGLDSGGLEGSWLRFWTTGWLKGGWLEGWLVVAGVDVDAGWEAGWPQGLLEPREPPQGVVCRASGAPEPTHLS